MRKLLPAFIVAELPAGKPVIKNAEGERLIALAVKFEEWLGKLLDGESVDVAEDVKVPPKQEQLWVWREGERILLPGKQLATACVFLRISRMKSGRWRRFITVVLMTKCLPV